MAVRMRAGKLLGGLRYVAGHLEPILPQGEQLQFDVSRIVLDQQHAQFGPGVARLGSREATPRTRRPMAELLFANTRRAAVLGSPEAAAEGRELRTVDTVSAVETSIF